MLFLYKMAQRLIDAVLFALAWFVAYQIRFDGHMSALDQHQMMVLLVPVVAAQLGISALLGIYRFKWRYIAISDALCIARAHLALPALLLVLRVALGSSVELLRIPGSVIAVTFVLSVMGALSVRVLRRWAYAYEHFSSPAPEVAKQRFLLVGAGEHGATVAREMVLTKGINVVGFVDDDPQKHNAVISGVPVLGPTADLPRIVADYKVDEILVCISPRSRRSLQLDGLATAEGTPIRSRIMPTLHEILSGGNGSKTLAAGLDASAHVNTLEKTNSNPVSVQLARNSHVGGNANGNGKSGSSSIEQFPRTTRASQAETLPAPEQGSVIRNKTIMITGGAGFIGSTLAEGLAEDNQLILLDQSFTAAPIQYTSLLDHPNVTCVQGSILEADLRSLVKEADIVVHAAAMLGVSKVCSFGRETLETNYVGTSRVLKSLDASPQLQRFVYFSTSEVFGVNSYRVDENSRPSVGPIAESRWSYAMSKLAGEHLVASYFRETGLPMAIIRPFNIFGPHRTGDYALRRFIMNALNNEPLMVHGDGTQIRSWCYIDDFCFALRQMMVRPEAVGEDFNIGNPGNTLTVYELAQKVIQLTNSSSKIVFVESPFPDISIRVPSLDKARRLLGYEPRFDLTAGLKRTIEWHRSLASSPALSFTPVAAKPALAEPAILVQDAA
jgi:dTDP-glucose 4,6-dehydratase